MIGITFLDRLFPVGFNHGTVMRIDSLYVTGLSKSG